MRRTTRAVLLAGFIVFAAVAGLGVFLGFEVAASLLAGVLGGALAGLVIWAAARRADSFHDQQVPPVEPGFPGPPEHRDEDDQGNGGHDDQDDEAGGTA